MGPEFSILMPFLSGEVRKEICERLAIGNVNLTRKATRS